MAAKSCFVSALRAYSTTFQFHHLSGHLQRPTNRLICNTAAVQSPTATTLIDILSQPENQPPQKEQQKSKLDNNLHLQSESSAIENVKQDPVELISNHSNQFRTSEASPENHSALDLSKFYTVEDDVANRLQLPSILRNEFAARSKALLETSLMVREQGLECLELLSKTTKPNSTAAKVLLYGKDGCGKSSVFAHSLHAAYTKGWMVICPVNQYLWNNYFKEISISSHNVSLPNIHTRM